METKLQELTKKLYEEGLVKGREEADTLIFESESKAKQILNQAHKEAERIISEARKNAQDLKQNSLAEITLAGKQSIATLKSGINEAIIAKSVSEPVKTAAMDQDFIKELLLTIAKNWKGSASGDTSLKALLPADMKSKLDSEFESKVISELGKGLNVSFSDKIKNGFKIAPKDGGYYISFTDADFDALLQDHLRNKISDILYGESK